MEFFPKDISKYLQIKLFNVGAICHFVVDNSQIEHFHFLGLNALSLQTLRRGLPFHCDEVDLVILNNELDRQDEILELCQLEAIRVLKPGGLLLPTTRVPHKSGPINETNLT